MVSTNGLLRILYLLCTERRWERDGLRRSGWEGHAKRTWVGRGYKRMRELTVNSVAPRQVVKLAAETILGVQN